MSETIFNPISWPDKVLSLELPSGGTYYVGGKIPVVKGITEDGYINLYNGVALGLRIQPDHFDKSGDQEVHISYRTGEGNEVLTLDDTVTVSLVGPKSLEILSGAYTTEYFEGDVFDKTGVVLKVIFNTGEMKTVEANNIHVDLTDPLTTEDTEVTYSYSEGGLTATVTEAITVNAVKVTSIDIVGPEKTEYYAGDALDLTGLVVTAHYNDSRKDGIIDDYTTSPADEAILGVNDNKVTVSYTHGATVTGDIDLTINIRPVDIELQGLGFGHLEGTSVVIDESEGVSIEDGVLSIDVSNITEEHPYAFIKTIVNEYVGHNISQYHWGLFENAESSEDIWGGIFHGNTLESCGNSIGLEDSEIVTGYELRMWVEETGMDDVVAKVTIQRIEPTVEA